MQTICQSDEAQGFHSFKKTQKISWDIIIMEMLHVWQIPAVLLQNYSLCASGMDSVYFSYLIKLSVFIIHATG